MSTPTDASAASTASRVTTVDDLCEHLVQRHGGDASLLCEFARLFFAKVPRQLLQERGSAELVALTEGAFDFLRRSRPDAVSVEVRNPEAEGWSAPVTLVRAEVGDRPFIVDTIREYLSAENLTIHHYIYPVLRVERGPGGEIARVSDPAAEDAGDGAPEALVHCEISRVSEAERREAICLEIEGRLRDVIRATDDFRAMLGQLEETEKMAERYVERFPEREEDFREILNFLGWLRDENFVFLGFRSYEIVGEGSSAKLEVVPGTGLGILRNEERSTYARAVPLADMSEGLRQRVLGGPVLIVSKTNAESTVHRRARMDYIGIKRLNDAGEVIGEDRFLGLFTSKAYAEHAEAIPILRRKLQRVLKGSGAPMGSHDYKEIITIFNSMPKEELFQASASELVEEVETVLSLLFSDEVRVTLRPDPLRRGVSVMVILPRGKFSGEIRHRIQEALRRRLEGTVLNYHLAMSAGDQARLHFYLSAPQEAVEGVSSREIEREVRQIIRSWEDRFLEELSAQHEAPEAARLRALYAPALSGEYRASTHPSVAVRDALQLERMRREGLEVAIDLRNPDPGADELQEATVLKLYLRGERLVLSDFMPLLENAGLRVIEVTPFAIAGDGIPSFMIYSFAVQGPEGELLPVERAEILAEMLLAVRRGEARDDNFNALVLGAGLRWREAEIVRAYSHYAFQIGAVPRIFTAARALLRHLDVARLLVELFRARFEPGVTDAERWERIAALRGALNGALEAVTALADDRALRRLCNLVEATMRTNYFRHGGAEPTFRSGGAPYLSLKIRSADVEELRKTRLLYEIYVHSANMEGIHLRGASVSRGGIRWSDRPDDFRTEVLGLVQTQVVKNAVIVPGGSKGGFITRRTYGDRERMGQEAAEQYRTLMRGMLDLTDNIVDGEVIPPPRVVRYDGDDPYLVVAADKGTAHLSDVANQLAAEYGFWLGDAFASGGSHGYDHKREGITARGAWECVKRHFREMGKDIQEEPFTVAGVGDMSGDVFGNGMLLSHQIRLVAAFDHRHIFLDPDPDPATSYAERERLFRLQRSSWEDYDRGLLSPGGMIVPRGSKEVVLTPQVRAALGLEESVQRLDGEALIRAVLRAPVELLWNGGIGTYVKDEEESHAEAGDSANDPVRVDAQELRCKVVGEGGNLGFTQAARIIYALRGGRINTDALDNSAGVDMSDHEVNLKILLNSVVTGGEMTFDQRNELLERMTDEVSELVLANNRDQSLAVSLDEVRSRDALEDFAALITAFEKDKVLERGAEGLPQSDEIRERAELGIGLTRPSLCVLLAYSKLFAKSGLLASPLPDDLATASFLAGYFPAAAVETAGAERLERHRLRREIVTTELVNDLVDLMGSSFLHRTTRDTGQGVVSVIRAWLIASLLSGAPTLRSDLAQLEGKIPAEVVYRWYFGLARVLERTTQWVLANVEREAPTVAVIEEHLDGLGRLRAAFAQVVSGADRDVFLARREEIQQVGAEPALAERIITLRFLPQLLDVLRIAQEAGADVVDAARAYYLVSEHFQASALRHALRDAASDDGWERRYAQALTEDVDRAHRAITRAVITAGSNGAGMEENVMHLQDRREREILSYRELWTELAGDERVPLAGYAVAVRLLLAIAE